jgi:hypothetical protein
MIPACKPCYSPLRLALEMIVVIGARRWSCPTRGPRRVVAALRVSNGASCAWKPSIAPLLEFRARQTRLPPTPTLAARIAQVSSMQRAMTNQTITVGDLSARPRELFTGPRATDFLEKDFEQMWHRNGLRPVWRSRLAVPVLPALKCLAAILTRQILWLGMHLFVPLPSRCGPHVRCVCARCCVPFESRLSTRWNEMSFCQAETSLPRPKMLSSSSLTFESTSVIVRLRLNNRSRCTLSGNKWLGKLDSWGNRSARIAQPPHHMRGIRSVPEQPRLYPAGPVRL